MKTATNGMGHWKSKTFSKKTKASKTTGKSKGIVVSPLERTICRRNRSWKMREYSSVMKLLNGEKRRSGKR